MDNPAAGTSPLTPLAALREAVEAAAAAVDLVVLAHLDQLDRRISAQEAPIVVDVVGERRPQATHGEDGPPHRLRW